MPSFKMRMPSRPFERPDVSGCGAKLSNFTVDERERLVFVMFATGLVHARLLSTRISSLSKSPMTLTTLFELRKLAVPLLAKYAQK